MNEEKKLARLVTEYLELRDAATQRDLAEMEEELWRTKIQEEGIGGTEKRFWLKSQFGAQGNSYDVRSTLWNTRQWSSELFDRWDKGLSPYVVARCLRMARKESNSTGQAPGVPLKALLERVDRGDIPTREEDEAIRVKAPKSTSAPSKRPTAAQTRSRIFGQDLKKLIDKFVEESMNGFDEETLKQELAKNFYGWVREAQEDLYRQLQKIRERGSGMQLPDKRVSRDAFRLACQAFAIDKRFGDPLDETLVKRRFFKRVAPLHPDRNPGSERHLEEYKRVVSAYEVLVRYMEERK